MRILFLLWLTLCTGCANLATYPPVESESLVDLQNPASEPVPTILAETISYAHSHFGGMDIIVFNLPKGVSEEAYLLVAKKLGDAKIMSSPNQIAYHVTELRVRGFSAEADLVFPSSNGGYEEATIKLASGPFQRWGVSGDRVWLIPLKEPPAPNFGLAKQKELQDNS